MQENLGTTETRSLPIPSASLPGFLYSLEKRIPCMVSLAVPLPVLRTRRRKETSCSEIACNSRRASALAGDNYRRLKRFESGEPPTVPQLMPSEARRASASPGRWRTSASRRAVSRLALQQLGRDPALRGALVPVAEVAVRVGEMEPRLRGIRRQCAAWTAT